MKQTVGRDSGDVPRNVYDQRNIETMELVYGEGFMSPGGADEVARIVAGLDLAGREILDVGCGLGGATIAFARDYRARHVTGIDVDIAVLERADALVAAAGVGDRVTLRSIEPGPLEFPDERFDFVYENSVSCHMQDLAGFCAEVKRVLRPGGQFFGSEWYRGRDEQAFEDWDELLRGRGLNFHFVARERFAAALAEGGLTGVTFRDRTEALGGLAGEALERVLGPLRVRLLDALGPDGYEKFVDWTRARANALTRDGMLHGHFRSHRGGEST